ncbi:MAG TPA: enoyl-CoA hydratase/isomerase family protein, partial [Solimonas sp.]|nr:enoyl-CoA hydratase/isomerase family protein [Solimonas sp.]
MTSHISLERQAGGIALLKLDRADARNALTLAMVRELHAALDALAADRDCRVVVLAGEGRGFCAGLDLKIAVFGDEAARNASEAMALQELFAGTVTRLRRLPQP